MGRAGPSGTTRPVPAKTAESRPFDTAILVIADPAVQADLKLRADQKRQVEAFLEKVGPSLWVMRDWSFDQSRDRLEPLIRQTESSVRAVLTKSQRQRLQQIMLQQRGPEALLRPEIAQVLAISAGQLGQLRSVVDETRRSVEQLGRIPKDASAATEHDRAAHNLRIGEQDRILAILTDAQEKSWTALRGRRFAFSSLQPFSVPTPELQGAEAKDTWVNSEPLSLAGLRGQVVVVHFWTFGCGNCIHNYPWYRAWQRDFAPRGVTVIGIHTPETPGERDVARVRQKAKDNGLVFPILIDNQRRNWEAWGNSVWPSVYLVDRRGRVRYWWYGELKWGGREGEKLMRERIEEFLAEPAISPAQTGPG
jgi:peroxiredoxin